MSILLKFFYEFYFFFFFFFNDTATTEIYTLSLHDALPIPFIHLRESPLYGWNRLLKRAFDIVVGEIGRAHVELQSPCNLVCRLLLEKKKRFATLPRYPPSIQFIPASPNVLLASISC